jgi:hypothetical protein
MSLTKRTSSQTRSNTKLAHQRPADSAPLGEAFGGKPRMARGESRDATSRFLESCCLPRGMPSAFHAARVDRAAQAIPGLVGDLDCRRFIGDGNH